MEKMYTVGDLWQRCGIEDGEEFGVGEEFFKILLTIGLELSLEVVIRLTLRITIIL